MKMKDKPALWGSLTCLGLCVHLSISRMFALVWVTNSSTEKSWLQKQFKLFGLFKVIFLPAPARQGKNYVPLYMTILKEAGSKQTVKWAWGPSWLCHRMLCVASWKSEQQFVRIHKWPQEWNPPPDKSFQVSSCSLCPSLPGHMLISQILWRKKHFFFYPICSIPSTNRFQLRLVGVVIMEIIAMIRFTVEPP